MSQFQPTPAYPGPYQYGGPGPVQNLAGLSLAVRILLGGMALASLVAAGVRLNRGSLIDSYLDGDATARELFDADDRVLVSMGFLVIGFISTGIVFIIWQYRHAKNGEILGANAGLGPGWAIGGWFIPIAGLVLPAIQLFQSSRGSNPERRGARIVIVWAVVFGIGSVGSVAAYSGQETDSEGNVILTNLSDIRDLADADSAAGVGFVVLAIAAVLALVMVAKLTNAQAAARPGAPQAGQYSPTASFGAPPPPPTFGAAPPPAAPPTQPPTAPPSGWTPPGNDVAPPG